MLVEPPRHRPREPLADARIDDRGDLSSFVLDDLPTSTKSPALDDANTRAVLVGAGVAAGKRESTVGAELVGRYLAWLVRAGFLPPPSAESPEKALPVLGEGIIKAAGRSGI